MGDLNFECILINYYTISAIIVQFWQILHNIWAIKAKIKIGERQVFPIAKTYTNGANLDFLYLFLEEKIHFE